ncbi:Acyl-CoA dehydrogenase [Candidatus Entotheonellaceae bacterium PAL068K]
MFELSEEQQAVQTSMRRFARRELRWRARKLDHAPPGTVDWDLLRKSCTFGLLSGQLPERYGGTMDRLSAAIVSEEIARWEAGTATLLAANSLAQTAIALSGNGSLIERLFAEITASQERQKPIFSALALTERHVGSDFVHPAGVQPARMMVTAKRRGDAYVLSGRKAYCAGGNIATWLCLFATLHADRNTKGLTGFLVPTAAAGFHVSEVLPTLGLRACPLVEFYVEGVTVPHPHRLTEEGAADALIQELNARGRCQGSAIAVGIAQGAFELARQHALRRRQGGVPIAQHQMVRHLLADMATQIEAARLLTYKAAVTTPPEVALGSMAKVFASDAAVKVATDAVQIMGAHGTTSKSGAEKYFRDAKMTQIFEGTNEICRLAITHPMLRDLDLRS